VVLPLLLLGSLLEALELLLLECCVEDSLFAIVLLLELWGRAESEFALAVSMMSLDA
jgi:hypothetical protein